MAHWRLAALIHGTWTILKLQARFALLLIVIGVITWNWHVGLTAAGQPSHDIGHNVHVYLECATSKCTCRVFDIFAARAGSIYFEPDQVNKSLCCNQYCLGLYILGTFNYSIRIPIEIKHGKPNFIFTTFNNSLYSIIYYTHVHDYWGSTVYW